MKIKKIKVQIRDYGDKGLWLEIDGDVGSAWAITKEELLPIRDAIDEYLKKSQLDKS